MQYNLPDSAKSSPPRPEHDNVAAVDPGGALTLVAELVGERKRVLDLGCGDGRLARLLSQRECDIVGVDINPTAVEEARRYCTHAVVADIDGVSLNELLGDRQFDIVVLGRVLGRLRQPTRLLDSVRGLLREGGLVVAVAPNVAHGAIRLSLLEGQFDGSEGAGLRLFTAKTIDELFLSAGYRIETIARTKAPIFDGSDLVPHLQRDDFEPSVVAAIELDPEAETLQFVVRAVSLSNDAKDRAISKRFLTANTELAASRNRLAKREREIERLTQLLADRGLETDARSLGDEATAQRDELAGQVATLRAELVRAESVYVNHAADLQMAADAAQAELAGAQNLAEQHRAHAAALSAERDKEMADSAALRGVIEQRDAEVVSLKHLVEQHRAHGEALRAERDKEMADSAALRGVIEQLQTRSASLEAQYEQASAQHAQASAQVVNLQLAVEGHEAAVKMLRIDHERAVAEIARLGDEIATFTGLLALADDDAKEAASKQRSAGLLADQLRDEIGVLTELRARADASLDEARAQADELEQRFETLQRHLVDQTQALLDQTRAEAARTAALIDTVQTSIFWKLKRAVGRVLGR